GFGVVGAFLLWNRAASTNNVAMTFNPVPLTAYQGLEEKPSLSPDGSSVAFTWNGDTEENWDIYVKLTGAGSPQRLTSDPAMDLNPAWSPDGQSIAFVRVREDHPLVVVIPSRGGPEREVLEPVRLGNLGAGQSLAWSADSRFLIAGTTSSYSEPFALTAVNVATLKTARITAPPTGSTGDAEPSVSPDGKMIAFVRRSGVASG